MIELIEAKLDKDKKELIVGVSDMPFHVPLHQQPIGLKALAGRRKRGKIKGSQVMKRTSMEERIVRGRRRDDLRVLVRQEKKREN